VHKEPFLTKIKKEIEAAALYVTLLLEQKNIYLVLLSIFATYLFTFAYVLINI